MKTDEYFVIEGNGGARTLSGKIRINGAKNAALKAMAASILFSDLVTLTNIPDNDDVGTMTQLLLGLGSEVFFDKQSVDLGMNIDTNGMGETTMDHKLAQGMRASIVLTGPMLGRFGRATFPAPGGCVIGARPIDLFLEAYKKMGAKIELKEDSYIIEATDGLKGAEIFFDFQTVGGTETIMMAAVLAHGTTTLKNCALEPEIVSVAEWLNSCGAKISGAGTPTMTIEGTAGKLLTGAGHHYETLPDRIEAGSYLILGALAAKDLEIQNCRPDHMEAAIHLLRNSGVDISVDADKKSLIMKNSKPASQFKPFNIRTHEYPGFPTDLQSPMVTFLTQVAGESVVLETIFEGRFKFTEELIKLGANITSMNPREIIVRGPTPFGALQNDDQDLEAHDIRAGFAVVMAAIIGKGTYKVRNAHYIDRGYAKIESKLAALGVKIERNVE